MRFVQGLDYGPRKGTLGWNIHMAEGGDGTVGWLAQRRGETRSAWAKRVNGVSASFVILTDGQPVQMVGWDRAAGNLNPRDRSTDKKFYGRRFLLAVLGDRWTNPNAYTLSMEVCGFRAEGPSRAQVETMLALIEESKRRFPTIVGAFGHADQTDTKGCPGTAPLMLEFWERAGHGLFITSESDMPLIDFSLASDEKAGTIKVGPNGASVVTIDGGVRPILSPNMERPVIGPAYLGIRPGIPHWLVFIGTKELGFVLDSDVTFREAGGGDPAKAADALRTGAQSLLDLADTLHG